MIICPHCRQLHGLIGVTECGHSFCEDCRNSSDRLDACAACEYGDDLSGVPS